MIPESAQVAALVILSFLLLAGLLAFIIFAQRKEAASRGQYLDIVAMSKSLGVEREFLNLKDSADINRYLSAMKSCNRCKKTDKCHAFMEGSGADSAATTKRYCPNADLLLELRPAAG